MKLLLITIFLISFGCAQKEYKINYHSKNILDLEVFRGKIIYFCSPPSDPEEPRQFLNIYLIRSGRIDLFFTRRKLEPKECKSWLTEIDTIYKGSKNLRIVGLEGTEEAYLDNEIAPYLGKKETVEVKSLWLFSRIVTEKGCVGHFGGECIPDYSEKSRFVNP